jgi:hypothetical protein
MSTIISFDIGIKNLAYCVFQREGEALTIRDWGIINLSITDQGAALPSGPLCNCPKTKSGEVCGKKAAFSLGEIFYCNVHAKSSGKLFPTKEISMPAIKKLKVDELTQFCTSHFISVEQRDKRADLLQKVQTHFEKRTLKVVPKPKKTNANQVHLVDIGKRIKTNFDEKFKNCIESLSNVILENQISPIAGRMNTIQGMVAQYFIMQSDRLAIDFISSGGKLKGLATSTKYSEHKKDGIRFCTLFLEANPAITSQKEIIEASAKKDDLADCFLQGIYFLKKQNIINYSDDLKIKFVS